MKSMDAYMMTNSMTSMIQYMQLKSIKINNNMKKKIKISNNDDNNNSNNDNNNSINGNGKIEGYLGSDLSKLDNDKQSRVLLYIGIALLPCLFLIPFVMSRDFVPPTDDTSPFGF
jgi:hypothetical protein